MIVIVRSLLIVTAVCLAAALLLGRESVSSFFTVFGITALIQFILHALVKEVLDFVAKIQIQRIETEQLKAYKDISYSLVCPCAIKNVEYQPIDINGNTTYNCNKCSKKINVTVNVGTALATDPIDSIDVNAVLKRAIEKEKQLEKNKEPDVN